MFAVLFHLYSAGWQVGRVPGTCRAMPIRVQLVQSADWPACLKIERATIYFNEFDGAPVDLCRLVQNLGVMNVFIAIEIAWVYCFIS